MELRTSSEAASYADTQEFPNILRNPKVHYRVHNGPPLVPILSQINPVHSTPSYLSKVQSNMNLPYTDFLHSVNQISSPFSLPWVVYPKNPSKSEALFDIL
jgi:hypothetical protein